MGAEGPHADYNTARMAISLEGFGSWTIMQDPTQQGTQALPRMVDIGSPGPTAPIMPPSGFLLSPALKSALLGRHLRRNEEMLQAVKNFFRSLRTNFCQDGSLKLISR
ncbi:hypothetical protein AVEN_109025-1 [Araneus ventricosus]|uniref:Uncharacterized protein n=1 Tax=Araneus ventricosus TaxID=182803 RepID=A0A4Y2HMN1_ARAVE|nr:hypothetical protein AVEN_109025-1 [Araneus ventricosus]